MRAVYTALRMRAASGWLPELKGLGEAAERIPSQAIQADQPPILAVKDTHLGEGSAWRLCGGGERRFPPCAGARRCGRNSDKISPRASEAALEKQVGVIQGRRRRKRGPPAQRLQPATHRPALQVVIQA